jgi:hypothetical protein
LIDRERTLEVLGSNTLTAVDGRDAISDDIRHSLLPALAVVR